MLLFHIHAALGVAKNKNSPKRENKQRKEAPAPFKCEKPLGERYLDLCTSGASIYLVSIWAENICFSFSKRQDAIV